MKIKKQSAFLACSGILALSMFCLIGIGILMAIFSPSSSQTLTTITSLPAFTATALQTLTSTPTDTATPPPPLTDTPLPTFTSTIAPSETPLKSVYSCIPQNPEQIALVSRVVDGDTIRVILDGQEYSVRYIGIDTPESTTQVEPFGKEASQYNEELVGGKVVVLVKDVSETDKNGRLLRYVLVDGLFVNLKLVQDGYARAVTYPPDVACADTFRQAAQQAREAGLGLWGLPVVQFTNTPATPTSVVAGGGKNCDPSYPDVCIPSPPPDLNCPDIPYRRFRVLPPDPHKFDGDKNGIGCEN